MCEELGQQNGDYTFNGNLLRHYELLYFETPVPRLKAFAVLSCSVLSRTNWEPISSLDPLTCLEEEEGGRRRRAPVDPRKRRLRCSPGPCNYIKNCVWKLSSPIAIQYIFLPLDGGMGHFRMPPFPAVWSEKLPTNTRASGRVEGVVVAHFLGRSALTFKYGGPEIEKSGNI